MHMPIFFQSSLKRELNCKFLQGHLEARINKLPKKAFKTKYYWLLKNTVPFWKN